MSPRLRSGAKPAMNITFRATQEQREAYERAADSIGARTLSDAITRALDAWAAEVNAKTERDLKLACASHPRDEFCWQCGPSKRPSKRSK